MTIYSQSFTAFSRHSVNNVTNKLRRPKPISHWPSFLLRDAMHKRGLRRHAVSVCLSVCLSRSWILTKRINISSIFFHHRVSTPFKFSVPNAITVFRRGHANGASSACGIDTNRDSGRITGYRSMTAAVRDQ